MYVSLPGVFNEIVINVETKVQPADTYVSLTLNTFLENKINHSPECTQEQQHYCILNLFKPSEVDLFSSYYLFGNMHEYYYTSPIQLWKIFHSRRGNQEVNILEYSSKNCADQ